MIRLRNERCSLRWAIRVLGFVFVLSVATSCITNKVLDVDWASFCSYSFGAPAGLSAGGTEAAIVLAVTAAPCVIAAATITAAVALDVVTFPYQLWKGWIPCRIGRIHVRDEP